MDEEEKVEVQIGDSSVLVKFDKEIREQVKGPEVRFGVRLVLMVREYLKGCEIPFDLLNKEPQEIIDYFQDWERRRHG